MEAKILDIDMKFIFEKKYSKYIKIEKCLLVYVYESVTFTLTFTLLLVNVYHMVIVIHSYISTEKCLCHKSFKIIYLN